MNVFGRINACRWVGIAAAMALATAGPGCTVFNGDRPCTDAACRDDREITARFNALLQQHPALEPPNTVRAQTIKRVVYLYGDVDTELERSDAEEIAHGIPGVRRVVNSISLFNPGY